MMWLEATTERSDINRVHSLNVAKGMYSDSKEHYCKTAWMAGHNNGRGSALQAHHVMVVSISEVTAPS